METIVLCAQKATFVSIQSARLFLVSLELIHHLETILVILVTQDTHAAKAPAILNKSFVRLAFRAMILTIL